MASVDGPVSFGEPGIPGPPGERGPAGPKGDQGDAGPAGDLPSGTGLVAVSGGLPELVTYGTNGQILKMVGLSPAFVNDSGGGGGSLPTGPVIVGSDASGAAVASTTPPLSSGSFVVPYVIGTSGFGQVEFPTGQAAIFLYDGSSVPQAYGLAGQSAYYNATLGQLCIQAVDGDETAKNALLPFVSYNWPTSTAALADNVGNCGRKYSHKFASGAAATTETYVWPASSEGMFDVVATFTITTAGVAIIKRITKTYTLDKTAAGVLTVAIVGSAVPEGGTIATADVTIAAGSGGSAGSPVLTITPPSGACNMFLEISGHLLQRAA